MTGTVMPTPLQTVLDANGNPAVGAKLFTYLSGTSTKVDTYTSATLVTANANPVIADASGRVAVWLSPGVVYKFACYPSTEANDPPTGTPYWTSDSVTAVPGANLALDISGTAGESLSAGNAVYMSSGSGGGTAGRWYKTDSDDPASSSTAGVVGMVQDAISNGATGSVRLQGRLTNLSGLTAGVPYYASATAGALTSSAPANSVFIGIAESSTVIVLQPSSMANAGLDARMTSAETNITSLQGSMTTANTNISTLQSTTATQTTNIATNTTNISTNTTNISTLTTLTAGAAGSMGTIDARLDVLLQADGKIVSPVTTMIKHTAGTGSGTGFAPVRFSTDSTTTSNVSTGETTLQSITLPASSLAVDNQVVTFQFWGRLASSANTKTIKFKFGGTSITIYSDAGNDKDWRLDVTIVRLTATTQTIFYDWFFENVALAPNRTSATETLTGAVTVLLTGQSDTASNDVTKYLAIGTVN